MRRQLARRLGFGFFICLGLVLIPVLSVSALVVPTIESVEKIRSAMFRAQLVVAIDRDATLAFVSEAEKTYEDVLSQPMSASAPEAHQRVLAAFALMQEAAQRADPVLFSVGRVQAWTSILAGSQYAVETALQSNDPASARAWLALREFRTATRFSRAGANATLALEHFAEGGMSAADAALTVRADLYDTYQARLDEALRELPEADQNGFTVRRAELAALVNGYFAILAPAYAEQRGDVSRDAATAAFADLLVAATTGKGFPAALGAVNATMDGFRAAPLSPADQARRARQLLRFVALIPVEYGRGVSGNRVIHDFEIQEAITFYEAAYAAFADLKDVLPPEAVSQGGRLFDQIGAQLSQVSQPQVAAQTIVAADPADVRKGANELAALLTASLPESLLTANLQGDFDIIASILDQVEDAVRDGEYELAESARLEAYAIMETGPEARLTIMAPRLTPEIENLFWNGQGRQRGLAYLINNRAALKEVQASRARLDALLVEAERMLERESSPLTIATNAGLIVFREGMEAVIILVSLMSGMRHAEERKYRKPMWVGVLAASVATLATWMLARGVLQSLARYGEKLEAVVSLIAVCVLLVIMNWFFHKRYWTNWIAQFHSRKRKLLTGEAGLMMGLITLGFASVYREGFEVVLFLQALVLEAGSEVVLAGTAVGLLLVILLGFVAFRLQVNLPYRNMLIVTGILLGVVLLQIVGKTVYSMQVVGWMPIHTLDQVALPYWWGSWFGVYPTWEGLILQFMAAGFVIGSFYLAERKNKSQRRRVAPSEA